ncbi:MAG: DUF4242 domain-containing protein [Bacteroidetes bacterium]|nr:DUF4242 domain-containing protein [Bacteroidota bacterium]MCW5894155.1 DUF4242 domain-containing protein [Bacteroidota bacterium]
MPKFLIERKVPGAGQLSTKELVAISQTSCNTLDSMGIVNYHWIQSYVTDDRIFCIHIAPDQEAIREHGRRGGFPVNGLHVVRAIIDPTTAEIMEEVPA